MEYPIKFILAAQDFKNASILSDDIPEHINKEMVYCERGNYFSATLWLPAGTYYYQYIADGEIISDRLRTPDGGKAKIEIEPNDGVVFDIDKAFVKNNHLVLMIGLNPSIWQHAYLNIQTLQGMKSIQSKTSFVEGSTEYQMAVIDIPSEEIVYAFFDLIGHDSHKFYGANGLKDNEWSVSPFEITAHHTVPINNFDTTGIYHLDTPKSVTDFEKHISYFEKFPITHVSGDIPEKSPLRKTLQHFEPTRKYSNLTCLLRDIFLEQDDFHASLGLLGRFAYEYRQDIATIPFALSDNTLAFWEITKRNFAIASRGICFQLLGSMMPRILFGEEIGLHKTGAERAMIWTKTKWNKDLYYLYQKLLKLRKKYPVLRKGRFRFVLQDCNLWGIERYMDGEDSIFIFGNHSKNNIIIDLTQIMNFNGPIVELLSDHALKRKKVCTLFGESIAAFKQNSTKGKKSSIDEFDLEIEDDEE